MKLLVLRGGEGTQAPLRPFDTCRTAPARSHGTLALTPDGAHWALLNISPSVAHQLETDPRLRAQSGESLDRLGLDSHGLMRVLLDIERELKLATSLELPDEALENPATLAAGVAQAVGGA